MSNRDVKNANRHQSRLMYSGKVSGGRKLKKRRLVKKFWKAVDNYNFVVFGEIGEL